MLTPLILLTTASASSLQESANGSFRQSEPDAAVQTRAEAALQATVAPMNFMVRSIAEGRLESALSWCGGYTFSTDDTHMTVQCDSKPPIRGALDGSPTPYTNDQGKSYTVTVSPSGSSAVFSFTGGEASLTTTYRFTDGGLQVTKKISSEHLEVPLQWVINYARQ